MRCVRGRSASRMVAGFRNGCVFAASTSFSLFLVCVFCLPCCLSSPLAHLSRLLCPSLSLGATLLCRTAFPGLCLYPVPSLAPVAPRPIPIPHSKKRIIAAMVDMESRIEDHHRAERARRVRPTFFQMITGKKPSGVIAAEEAAIKERKEKAKALEKARQAAKEK